MSYMTSATLPRPSAYTPLPALRVSVPIMKAQDGTPLFALQTKKPTTAVALSPPPTNPHIDSLFSMFPPSQKRYFLKKTPSGSSRAKDKDTRSKARPGFRKGKWTDEESKFAEQMAHYFKEGLLPLEKGTMLRMYLAEKLNCEPMRITKKFTGDECIGKQIFRPMPPSPLVEQRIQEVQQELEVLEKAFLERIEEMPMYCMSTKKGLTPEKQPKRAKKLVQAPSPVTHAPPRSAAAHDQTHDAASLLLGFFHQTHVTVSLDGSAASAPSPPHDLPEVVLPSLSPKEDVTVYRSKRKFSISHCVAEYESYMQRPRIDSFSLVSSN